MGQITNYFIISTSRSCPGSALTFIGGIIVIPLTVSVSLMRSTGTVDIVREADISVPLSVIYVRSISTVADVCATKDVDATLQSMMILSLRICRYLPIS